MSDEVKKLNEQIFDQLAMTSAQEQAGIDAVNNFTRTRMKEALAAFVASVPRYVFAVGQVVLQGEPQRGLCKPIDIDNPAAGPVLGEMQVFIVTARDGEPRFHPIEQGTGGDGYPFDRVQLDYTGFGGALERLDTVVQLSHWHNSSEEKVLAVLEDPAAHARKYHEEPEEEFLRE
jgi:hypothetical protein